MQNQVTAHSDPPKCLVLGAQKAGTTSLDSWLRLQPEISLPSIKETHYLSDDTRYAKGIDWYVDQFRGSGNIKVEVDPDYLSERKCPVRAKQLYGNRYVPRLVVIIRESVDRAISQWKMSVKRGQENRSFQDALNASYRT